MKGKMEMLVTFEPRPSLEVDSFMWTRGTIGDMLDGRIDTRRCIVYMIRESPRGEMLYIGASNYWVTTRLKGHRYDKGSLLGAAMRQDMERVRGWWVDILTMPDRETALSVEAEYIAVYRPQFNKRVRNGNN